MFITGDDQNELFDIVDENDKVVGKARRGEVHKNKNLIHRSIGVAVFNSKGEIFLQQRSASKDTDPLKWTISCSGHVNTKIKNQFFDPARDKKAKIKNTDQKARIYEEAARRELMEELGVDLLIVPVCKYLCRTPIETEMVMLYKAITKKPFKLNPAEILQGKFFTQKELLEALKSGEIELSFWAKVALEKLGWNFSLDKE